MSIPESLLARNMTLARENASLRTSKRALEEARDAKTKEIFDMHEQRTCLTTKMDTLSKSTRELCLNCDSLKDQVKELSLLLAPLIPTRSTTANSPRSSNPLDIILSPISEKSSRSSAGASSQDSSLPDWSPASSGSDAPALIPMISSPTVRAAEKKAGIDILLTEKEVLVEKKKVTPKKSGSTIPKIDSTETPKKGGSETPGKRTSARGEGKSVNYDKMRKGYFEKGFQ